MQRRRWMKHGDHKTVGHFLHLPMDLCDLCAVEEQTHRKAPQRDDDAWIDDLDLVLKIIAGAGFYLIGQRIAIPRWAALDHIRDPDIRTGHACLFEQLVEEFPRRTDEGTSLLIFTCAGSFANEHDLGMRGPLAGDGFLARAMKFALRADHDLPGKLLQFLFSAHFVLPYSTWNAHRQRANARHSTQINSSGSRLHHYPGNSAAGGLFPRIRICGTFPARQDYLRAPPKRSSARLHASCLAGHAITTVCLFPAGDNQGALPGWQRALHPRSARLRSCRPRFHPGPPPSSGRRGFRSARTGTTVRARAG